MRKRIAWWHVTTPPCMDIGYIRRNANALPAFRCCADLRCSHELGTQKLQRNPCSQTRTQMSVSSIKVRVVAVIAIPLRSTGAQTNHCAILNESSNTYQSHDNIIIHLPKCLFCIMTCFTPILPYLNLGRLHETESILSSTLPLVHRFPWPRLLLPTYLLPKKEVPIKKLWHC